MDIITDGICGRAISMSPYLVSAQFSSVQLDTFGKINSSSLAHKQLGAIASLTRSVAQQKGDRLRSFATSRGSLASSCKQ